MDLTDLLKSANPAEATHLAAQQEHLSATHPAVQLASLTLAAAQPELLKLTVQKVQAADLTVLARHVVKHARQLVVLTAPTVQRVPPATWVHTVHMRPMDHTHLMDHTAHMAL